MDSASLSTTLQTYIHQLRKPLTLPELVAGSLPARPATVRKSAEHLSTMCRHPAESANT